MGMIKTGSKQVTVNVTNGGPGSGPHKGGGKGGEDETKSRNPVFGYYGTTASNLNIKDSDKDDRNPTVDKHFAAAHAELVKQHGLTPGQARDYLDSSSGRHLADRIHGDKVPVAQAVNEHGQGMARWKRKYRAEDYGD
jgi:hypothetical protein